MSDIELRLQCEKNYSNLTNDQPIHVCIKVEKGTRVQDVIDKIMKITEVNIDFEEHRLNGFTDLMLYSKNLGIIRGVFTPSY